MLQRNLLVLIVFEGQMLSGFDQCAAAGLAVIYATAAVLAAPLGVLPASHCL